MHNLSNRRIAAIVAVCLGVGLLAGYLIWGTQSPRTVQKIVVEHTTSAPATTSPARPIEPVVLVAGSENDPNNRVYACGNGYLPTDVAVGKVVTPSSGTQLSLTETRNDADWQSSVTAEVTIGKGYILGGAIIVTAAHVEWPDTYPEYKLTLPVDAQGNASLTLQDQGYVENDQQAGITYLTFCLKQG